MKNKFLKILSLLSVFAFCSCFNFENKDISKMNVIELSQYNKQLKEENETLSEENEILSGVADGKTYKEVLEMINYVNEEVIKSNVMITSQSRVIFQTTSMSSGSGTIIKEDSTYYYVLTNNHVIYSFGTNISYYVYDYLNNEYSKAKVLFSDPDYDLAILRFAKGKDKLRVATLSQNDAEIEDNVIVIGQPQGQRNTITFGEVLSYGKVECSGCNKEESNIKYDCVYYDAIPPEFPLVVMAS